MRAGRRLSLRSGPAGCDRSDDAAVAARHDGVTEHGRCAAAGPGPAALGGLGAGLWRLQAAVRAKPGSRHEFSLLALSANSTTLTGGMLGGADYTLRNVASAGDGLIVGLLIGFEFSDVSLRTSSVSSDPTSPNGNSTYNAHLSGPATGVYALL